MRSLIMLGFVLANTACLRETQYQCSGNNSACGAGGQCETSGFCSFPDGECSSGRRYSDAAGSLAGQCTTGGSSMIDASNPAVDMSLIDGSGNPDMSTAPNCPAGYVTIPNGQAGHLYRILPNNGSWMDQQGACTATSQDAHLAIPDDAAELMAIDAHALTMAPIYWIGVSDSATEGMWRTVLNAAQTYLPWQPGSPNMANNNQDDCVQANAATHQFIDDRCNTQLPAVCECE